MEMLHLHTASIPLLCVRHRTHWREIMPLAGLGTPQCPWEVDGEREEFWYLTAAPTTRTHISSTR